MTRKALLSLLLVLVAMITAPLLAQNNPDTAVWTDRGNYLPGEVVTVTGVGFQPGEIINLVFRVDGREDRTSTANADENGGFTNNTFSPDSLDAEATIKLIATGTTSGFEAVNYFLDDPPPSCASGFTVDPLNGTSAGPVFQTIQQAVNSLPSTGPCVVTIKTGTYNEHVEIGGRNSAASSDSQRVVFRRDPAASFGSVVVSSASQSGNDKKFPFLIQNSKFITITGLRIAGATDTGVSIGASSSDITIEANDLTGNASAIGISSNLPRIWILNNLIHGNTGIGVSIGGPNTNRSFIVNNTIYSNGNHGIAASSSAQVAAVNNLILFNTGIGFQQTSGQAPTAATLISNMFYKNGSGDIANNVLDSSDSGNYVSSGSGTGIADCTFTGCGTSHTIGEILNGSGHLASGSPAADKGTNMYPSTGSRVPTTDIDGEGRPVNNTVDIGADEAPLSNPPGVPTITGKPTDPTNQTSATFTFVKNSNDTGTISFECSLDAQAYAACESGAGSATYTSLSEGQHTFSVRAKNSAGTSQPAQYSWTVDTVAGDLTITSKPADPTNSTTAKFEFNSNDASAAFQCKLDAAAYADCVSGVQYPGLAEGAHTFTVKATDNVGNTTTQSYTWHIDATAPTLDITRVTAANGDGWNNSAVQLTVTCNDANGIQSLTASGAASGSGASPLSLTVSTEGANQSVTANCTDNAGNEATKTLSQINIDLTKPVITGSRTPAANANGWNKTDVTVSFTCADTGSVQSGIKTDTVAGQTLSAEGQNLSVPNTGACTDKAGNAADAATVSNINIDKTAPNPPATQVTPAPNAAGWNNTTPVTVKFTSAGDVGSVQSGVDTCTSDAVLSSETSGTDESGTCTDKAGNVSTASKVTVRIDTTKPEITYVRAPQANTYGWNNTAVTVTFACADKGTIQSGIETDSVGGDKTVSDEGANQAVASSGSCTDKAGNTADHVTVNNINIDTTKPTISASRTPDANAHGWNNTDVTATYNASDGLSGLVEDQTDSHVFNSEGSGQSYTFTVHDKAGNPASAEIKDVNIDKTKPTVTPTPSPAANANGWNNTDVTVSFVGNDSLSGIDQCDAAKLLNVEGAGQSATGSCTDKAGNSASGTVSNINIDKTPPTITFASRLPAANQYGWNNTDVSVTWNCSDVLSGTTAATTGMTLSAEAAGQTATGVCTDKAGNNNSSSLGDINIDKKAPVLSPTVTPTPVILNGPATAADGATDALSGIATHGCTQPDSSSVGLKTLTCTATDKAGNVVGPTNVSYSVQYLSAGACMGDMGHAILQPIDADGSSVFKQKSTVPAKFRVCDANGASIGTAGVVSSFRLVGTMTGTASAVVDEAVVSTTPDTTFRWDPTSAQWIFNMNTKPLNANVTYVYRITLNDNTTIDYRFGLK